MTYEQHNPAEGADVHIRASSALVTVGIFMLLTTLLIVVGFVPEPRTQASDDEKLVVDGQMSAVTLKAAQQQPINAVSFASAQEVQVYESSVPVRVVAPSIGLDTTIITPESADIETLDRALLSGAVHYPGSGESGQTGNMLLFGHSSYLPMVQNKAFKAFNELGKLQHGAEITVYSETHIYRYVVDDVWLANAEDTQVGFYAEEPTLTLATCNNFGAKQERWIVVATFIDKEPRR